jgi:hypothetical protein
MASIEGEPVRIETPGPYMRSQLSVLCESLLPPPLEIPGSFMAALSRRRSAEVVTPISADSLATWLHSTSSIHAINTEDANRQRRYVASFGALHSTHVLLGDPSGSWNVYIPERRALGDLQIDTVVAAELRTKALQYFHAPDATLVALIGNSDLAAHYYLDPLSLKLRDAGVLFGHAALVAAALGLGSEFWAVPGRRS